VASAETIVCAVLAAGRSSRMGSPKALIEIGGERALARVLRIAGALQLPAIVVLGHHEEAVRKGVDLGASRVVVNPDPDRGQSSSVRLAAQSVPAGAALALWPVDHARVEAATVERLLAAFRARAQGIELIVPSHGGRRGHPLLASAAATRELASLRDDEPAHVVVRRDPRRVFHVEVDDPMVVADFDRPEDLAPGRSSHEARPTGTTRREDTKERPSR
jgi:CTP:molybdopterin cytidylyltransferase MocA